MNLTLDEELEVLIRAFNLFTLNKREPIYKDRHLFFSKKELDFLSEFGWWDASPLTFSEVILALSNRKGIF